MPEEPISGLWRSQDMTLVMFNFERDSVRKDLLRLGRLGCCQFRNENVIDPHKEHMQGVRDADTLDRQCRFFREQLNKWKHLKGQTAWPEPRLTPRSIDGVPWYEEGLDLEKVGTVLSDGRGGRMLHTVALHEADLREHIDKFNQFRASFKEWYFRYEVLQSQSVSEIASGARGGTSAHVVGGALPRSKMPLFLRVHQRRSRQHASIDPRCDKSGVPEGGFDSVPNIPLPNIEELLGYHSGADTDDLVHDVMYNESGDAEEWVVFVSTGFSEVIKKRVLSLCSTQEAKLTLVSLTPAEEEMLRRSPDWRPLGVGGANYRLPTSAGELMEMRREAQDRMKADLEMLLQIRTSVRKTLDAIAPCMVQWEQIACVHKAMSYNLGLLKRTSHSMEGVAWVPSNRVPQIRACISTDPRGAKMFEREHLSRADKAQRPTYFETNAVTSVFQGIVDSYGTPRYKEANPAIFTIITFPYLFGVMYGDIGHGLIISIAAFLLIKFEGNLASIKNEMFQMIFGARYLLLLMGIFATYMGFLYNDCFALMLEYSPSRYNWPADWQTQGKANAMIDPVCVDGHGPCAEHMAPPDGPTPFGFDVAWHDTGNKIDVYNSFKEKHAVILGVTQMTLGLFLQFANHIYFARETGDYKRIFFGFIPEVIFLMCTFGYMCVIIIYKWVTPPLVGTNNAPNLLETMTNFFLAPGSQPTHALFDGQAKVQLWLITVAVIAVFPFMLLPIPYIEWKQAEERKLAKKQRYGDVEMQEQQPLLRGKAVEVVVQDELPEIDMQEVVIKQVIHCIEFVLGAVSNTASYLRLWALSLAHAQLSEVFWTFAFMLPFKTAGPLGLVGGAALCYASFGVWISVTIGVLVLMEALSAFLHALRLHWVEFQNKFYYADGNAFEPLDFDKQLQAADLPTGPWDRA
eukprot:TRINITY_DN3267_c0_g1_i1.p1 TRINITY_DN3267_c0_g1~~TRINITY_DN3267_c0_g1_i1.p1  ORF type:complete len:913 (+),score=340.77 TRINITY_DN3267_c0_g1_i1:71-2809(+)